MTLLTIARAVAVNVGVSPPVSVMTNSDADAQKIIQFSEEAGVEIARRVNWGALRKTVDLTGTGANEDFALPTDFSRLVRGNAVTCAGIPVRVGLTADEWNSITPIEGTPRYARLLRNVIGFYPYPALAQVVTVTYQSANWNTGDSSRWVQDANEPLFPETLVVQGAIVRWRRQAGMDFQDYLSEFEASLTEYAQFDDGMRQP